MPWEWPKEIAKKTKKKKKGSQFTDYFEIKTREKSFTLFYL